MKHVADDRGVFYETQHGCLNARHMEKGSLFLEIYTEDEMRQYAQVMLSPEDVEDFMDFLKRRYGGCRGSTKS